MARPVPIPARALLVVLLLLGTPLRSGRAEPERPEGAWRLSAVQPNGAGEATETLRVAVEALDAERWDEAVRVLLALRADHGDVLVPVPRHLPGEAALHWPTKHVVELLVDRLPTARQEEVRVAWRAVSGALVERARRGDERALERLADDWAATAAGRAALDAVAARDLEAGRYAAVVRRLEHWLRLSGADVEARARVLLELVDALAALGDEAALEALPDRFEAEMGRPVRTAQGTTSPRLRVRKRVADLRVRRRLASRRAVRESDLPRELAVLWTRRHEQDERIARPAHRRTAVRTLGGAAADGEALILHEGRVVRRLEGCTGRELWRFPPPAEGRWNYDLRHRYAPEDLPLRTVDVAGDLVLVVLGEPVAQGSFEYLGQQLQLEDQARASRTRLVALDRRTGALRWATGGPGDRHPVLGDPLVGCQSPPLVVGDAVYAVFARRRGGSEIHLACLDLATGAPRWVSYLGAGESGRSVDAREADDRFGGKRAKSAPWAARPVLADGELCVLPHAGFVAGVDAANGAVRWLRVLPRFDGHRAPGPEEGFSGRNVPLAHGATWVLAPLDCPVLVGLERGTGAWRYAVGTAPVGRTDPWHHAISISEDAPGGPWLQLLYTESGRLRLAHPEEGVRVGPQLDGYVAVGLPLDLGSEFVVAGALGAGTEGLGLAPDEGMAPALFAVPWDPERQARPGAIRHWLLDDADFPRRGDVLQVGELWVVVGQERTGAVAPPRLARAWARDRLASPDADAADRAAAAALLARLDDDAPGAAEALRRAAATGETAALEVALDAVRRVVASGGRDVEGLGAVVLEHAPQRGADVLADLATHNGFRRHPADLVELLDRWIATAEGPLVTTMPGVAVRSDLFAGLLLRILATDPTMAQALAARERAHAAAVEAAAGQGEAALREAIRRAVGTRAATEGRERLGRLLEEAGRSAAAAAVVADLRLDGGSGETERAARTRLAALQRREAALWARGGHAVRARHLLRDLRRWAPREPGSDARSEQEALETLLAMEAGWQPSGAPPVRLDLWRDLDPARDAGELRGVVVPTLVGPGAATRRDALLVFRGLTAEIWSRRDPARRARFEDPGRGWFGGALQEAPPWLGGGGVIVTSLVAGEPADRAGLREGDWLLTWNGEPVRGASDFMRLAAASPPGTPVTLDVRRRGRKVLDRMVPGSRPLKDGVVVDRDVVWIDANGRALVPGRVDVAWIDLERGTREALWRWEEPGVVRRVAVIGDLGVVVVRRLLQHDTLVGLDLATGAERWRRDVSGTVTRLDGTGSAIVAVAADPARAVVVDPWDGSVRAVVELQERTAEDRPFTLFEAPSCAFVHGRAWCLTGDPGRGRHLRILNTTTGDVTSERLDDHDLQPLIAADGVVAIAFGEATLRIDAPDPVTGRPAWRVEMPDASGTRGGSFPELDPDPDTRLFVAGDRVYVLRNPRRQSILVEVLELDLEALGPGERPGRVPPARVLRYVARLAVHDGLGVGAYVTDARANLEGLVLAAASTGDRQRRVTAWIGRRGTRHTWPDPAAADTGGVVQVRRNPAARVADVLVVPSDEGAQLVPLRPGDP